MEINANHVRQLIRSCLPSLILALILQTAGGMTAFCRGGQSLDSRPGAGINSLHGSVPIDVSWTGNSGPFVLARRSVDRLFASGAVPASFIDSCARNATAHPQGALEQFQWAYAVFKQRLLPHPSPLDSHALVTALASAKQPNVYEYSRLRFLLEGTTTAYDALAKKLLEHTESDPPVQCLYSYLLSTSKSKSDSEKAIAIAESVVSSGKDNLEAYYNLGWVYADVGYLQQDNESYKKSIDALNRYLVLSDQTVDWRGDAARHCIDVLQRRLKKVGD